MSVLCLGKDGSIGARGEGLGSGDMDPHFFKVDITVQNEPLYN